jgi:ankyrin repeat protein
MAAAIKGSLPVVKLLLENGADPFAKDVSGWAALAFAETNSKRVANHLRKLMNASLQAADVTLHDAARGGLAERARQLLDQGSEIDPRDDLGRTPLHWAVMGGRVETVRLLLEPRSTRATSAATRRWPSSRTVQTSRGC